MTIRTAYDGSTVPHGLDTGSESHVDQSYKDECDINRIMRRYEKDPNAAVPQVDGASYLDVSEVGSFFEAQLLVKRGEAAFAALDSRVRERFHNSAVELMQFLDDPNNEKEARKLGILKPVEPAPSPVEVRVINTTNPEGGTK